MLVWVEKRNGDEDEKRKEEEEEEEESFQLKILGGPSKRNKFPKVITSSLCKFYVAFMSMWLLLF